MAGTISCPECGSGDVVCTEDPHHHECRACGYSMLPKPEGFRQLPVRVEGSLRTQLEENAATNGRTLTQSIRFLLEQALGLRPPAPESVPMVLSNEDGDTWWAKGHVSAPAMVLGAVLEQTVCLGPEEAAELLTDYSGPRTQPLPEVDQRGHADALVGKVRHVWMVQDPDNEERMLEVTRDVDGAEAWTRLTL